MQDCSKPTFKYCIVPLCKNTNKNALNKVFFLVPRGAILIACGLINMQDVLIFSSSNQH